VSVGPFRGRQAILEAYRSQPPDDQIDLLAVHSVGDDHIEADYAWRREAGKRSGRMILNAIDRRISRLVVTFEPT
jgi:hypothetical protein